MRKIHSIDSTGKILFVDDKGTSTTTGTTEDCSAYGYEFINGICRIPTAKDVKSTESNFVNGRGNKVYGKNNYVLGSGNKIYTSNSYAIGKEHYINKNSQFGVAIGVNAYIDNYGEIAMSCANTPNRAKYTILQFDGITTNATVTELFLGNSTGERFKVNTDYESVYAIDYSACALNPSLNLVWTEYGHATYKYVNSTLTEVGHQKGTLIRDSALDYACDFSPQISVTPHISVDVQGEAGHTAYWTVVCRITEVRYV
jgi:hypothetical protein